MAIITGGSRGYRSGRWEDSYPPEEMDIAIEEIKMVLGTRRKTISWDLINVKAKDRIKEEIEEAVLYFEDGLTGLERRYDSHIDR